MKKHILLFFATVFSLATFAQNKDGGWDISVGATAMAPMAKKVDWDSKDRKSTRLNSSHRT